MGRDIFARLLYGGRTSLLVGFASAALGAVLGVPLGLLAGYKGGKWEYWIMRACDTFQSFPSIILVLAIVNLVGPSVWNIILVIGGLGWASVARLVYSGTLSAKKAEYVEASRVLGATDRDILFRTILPNVVSPVWAALPLKVVRAILSESSLSFLGVGLRTPEASWGNMAPVRHGAGEPHHPPLGVDPAGAVHCGHRAGPAAGGGGAAKGAAPPAAGVNGSCLFPYIWCTIGRYEECQRK